MKKRKPLISSLILLALVGGSVLWGISRSTANTHSPQVSTGPEQQNPLVRLNRKARTAKDGNETATHELVDEMFQMFNLTEIPAGVEETLKSRLVRAEVNYRTRKSKSNCSEFRLVQTVNSLAGKMGTPAYTRTNVFEVRRLRANLLIHAPDLLTWPDKNEHSTNDKRNRSMSPLESFFVAVTLLQQKRFNAEYQITNEEWIALHGGNRSATANSGYKVEMQRRRIDSNRSEEVRTALKVGFAAMTPIEIARLPEQILNTLGVER